MLFHDGFPSNDGEGGDEGDECEVRWVRQARAGCRESFGLLLDRNEGAVFAFIMKSLQCDPETAADITQDTFETACLRLHRFRGEARFRSWLIGIAINRMRSWRRGRRFRELLGLEAAMSQQETDARHCPAHLAEVSDDWQRMETAFQCLSQTQREALYLREVAGFSHAEIGECLRLNRNTVKSRIHSARQAMIRSYRHDTVE